MKVMRVIEAFSTDVDGVPRVFTEGMLLKSSDPVCKGRGRFLMDAEVYTDRAVSGGASDATETATAAPGERRARWARKSAQRAQKRAEDVNPRGADDGEKDPESGSNQVPGVNRKDPAEDPTKQTAEQKRSEKAALAVAEEVNRTGADDGEPDPESGPSQIPGVNDDPDAEPGDGYDDDSSGTADDGGPTTGITAADVEPVESVEEKPRTAKKAASRKTAKKV